MTSPKRIVAILLCASLAILIIIAGIKIHQKQAQRNAFHQKIDSLVQQASKLAAMTTQGVSFNDFNSQLAAVHGEYDLVKNQWEYEKWPEGGGTFSKAVGDWDLALLFWKRDLHGSEHFSSSADLLSFYIDVDPMLRAVETKFEKQGVNLYLATQAFLTDGGDRFEESKKSIQKVL